MSSNWAVMQPQTLYDDVREVAFRLRQFLPDELPPLRESAGFQLAARYGDFDRNPLGARSRLQVCLAEPA